MALTPSTMLDLGTEAGGKRRQVRGHGLHQRPVGAGPRAAGHGDPLGPAGASRGELAGARTQAQHQQGRHQGAGHARP